MLNYFVKATRSERRKTIGAVETWPTTKAREEAKRLKQQIDSGRDPLAEEEERRDAPTMEQLAALYVEKHSKKKERSGIEDKRLLPIILADLGRMKVSEVRYANCEALHRKVGTERGKFRANRVLALLSKMFSIPVKEQMRVDNPCKAVEGTPAERIDLTRSGATAS